MSQLAVAARVAAHVPPVPGNVPPTKVNGAVSPVSEMAEAVNPPPLVRVNVLEAVAPTATVP